MPDQPPTDRTSRGFEEVVEALRKQQDEAPPGLKAGIGYAAAWLRQNPGLLQLVEERPEPSSEGRCAGCGEWAERRYGGEGRHPVMCLDCWRADASPEELGHQPEGEPSNLALDTLSGELADLGDVVVPSEEDLHRILCKIYAIDHPQDRG